MCMINTHQFRILMRINNLYQMPATELYIIGPKLKKKNCLRNLLCMHYVVFNQRKPDHLVSGVLIVFLNILLCHIFVHCSSPTWSASVFEIFPAIIAFWCFFSIEILHLSPCSKMWYLRIYIPTAKCKVSYIFILLYE